MKTVCKLISDYMGVLVLLAAVLALLFPEVFSVLRPTIISPLLGVIMFGMGLTLNLEDFRIVFSRPRDVMIGCLAQFTIMPLLAWILAKTFSLDEALTVGVVLVGCCPGGTASNVITYLAKGDLALSVGMTGISTLLAPVLTPLLVWFMAGKSVDVDVMAMFLSILWVVILPIIVGLAVKRLWPNKVERATAYLPALSSLAIATIVIIVISANANKLLAGGLIIVLVVMLHNICGLSIGYLIGRLLHMPSDKRKAVSIEVGMQNSGLASSLATLHFATYPMATIPGAQKFIPETAVSDIFFVSLRQNSRDRQSFHIIILELLYQEMSNKKISPSFRNERLDSVKYWLIILVISGHVLEIFQIPENKVIWNWIFLFHMPLFIFISGYFSSKKSVKKMAASIWKIAEPLILFQFIALILWEESISLTTILTPWWILWYLLSLIYWRLILQVIPESILRNAKLILPTTFGISILAGFLPFGVFLSIQRTLSFMPFFFLGYYMKNKNIFLPQRYRPLCLLFLIIAFVVPLFCPQYLGNLRHADPYDNYYDAFKRLFAFCLSIPMSLAFLNVCISRPWFARQGQLTMQYYLYHSIIIVCGTTPFLILVHKFGITSLLLIAIIYSIAITIVIGVLSYIPIFKYFTNPSVILKKLGIFAR